MSEKRSNTGLLKFRVPMNDFFPDQVVHNFQLKLLRNKISTESEDRKSYEEMLMKARSLVQKKSTNNGGHPFSAS